MTKTHDSISTGLSEEEFKARMAILDKRMKKIMKSLGITKQKRQIVTFEDLDRRLNAIHESLDKYTLDPNRTNR